eukprot:CAMPEP_0175977018 /NCGR_PEP_ID=MMETSP0108-20121206/44845_1 /TAXON_ID=195067 ORGANISM="Goniomonas pacifica, Strain CCMP1869" /NCGR_SAMPLE_ID=MMETSP0108 /ASSEMBLY_ACC=CAM_ASM_000204 /LENGTH=132 /DNA_ID=CAMNT_0017306987 /DNA_START=1 /DNA_END=400 /DNA_ORIENTATION=+
MRAGEVRALVCLVLLSALCAEAEQLTIVKPKDGTEVDDSFDVEVKFEQFCREGGGSFVWVAVPDSEPVTTGHLEAYLNKKRHRASVVNCEDKDALMGLEGVPAGDHDLRLKLVDGGGRTRAQQRIQVKARGP